MNKLDPKLDNSKFSIKEEVRMLELLKKHGRSNWHKIAADLNRERGKNCLQRNEIQVKNRCKCLLARKNLNELGLSEHACIDLLIQELLQSASD